MPRTGEVTGELVIMNREPAALDGLLWIIE